MTCSCLHCRADVEFEQIHSSLDDLWDAVAILQHHVRTGESGTASHTTTTSGNPAPTKLEECGISTQLFHDWAVYHDQDTPVDDTVRKMERFSNILRETIASAPSDLHDFNTIVRLSGVKPHRLMGFLCGAADPELDELIRLGDLFEKSPTELYTGQEA
jgi:hypothetical protein